MPTRATPPPQHDPDEARDHALIAAIRAGGPADRRAWAELVERHQNRLFAICVRMVGDRDTASDLTQDTFVKIIQGLETYDGRAKLSTWMIRVAMNVCLSHLRAQKLRRHASLDAEGVMNSLLRGSRSLEKDRAASASATPPSPRSGAWESGSSNLREQSPTSSVEQGALRRVVAKALSSLDPEQRAILILRDVQGLEYEQIAAALEVPGGTVKSRLFRARLALREAIEKLDPEAHS